MPPVCDRTPKPDKRIRNAITHGRIYTHALTARCVVRPEGVTQDHPHLHYPLVLPPHSWVRHTAAYGRWWEPDRLVG
jgi:hypothetical protein